MLQLIKIDRFDFDVFSLHRFGEQRAYSISGLYNLLILNVVTLMHNREGVRKNPLFGQLDRIIDIFLTPFLKSPSFNQYCILTLEKIN